MKYLLVAYLIFLISCESEKEVPCIPNSLTKNTVAFYTFNNGSLSDKSGNDLHLVNPNKVKKTTDRLGNPDCAYAFNGSLDQYLSRHGRFLDDYHKNCFSVSLWYKPVGTRDDGQYEFILGRNSTNNRILPSNAEWSIGLSDCRRVVFKVNRYSYQDEHHPLWKDESIIGNKCELELTALSDVWHHLVVTSDGKISQLYRNSIKANRADSGFRSGSISRNLGDFFIGRGFHGVIDDIIIFDKILSPSEVNELYNMEPCCQ